MRKFIQINDNNLVIIELYPNKDNFSVSLNIESDCERTVSLGLTVPFLFCFYFTLSSAFLAKQKFWKSFINNDYGPRLNYLDIFRDNDSVDGGYNISVNLWSTYDSSNTFFSWFANTNSIIFGGYDLTKETKNVWNERVFIPGVGEYDGDYYDLIVKEELYSYKWKRFNRFKVYNRFSVDCEKGVPNRFKWGTQDRSYGLTLAGNSCSSKDEAIQKFIEDIQETRLK